MLDREHEPKDTQMLQIFQKLQCLTDTSILTMICKRFIYVLTIIKLMTILFLCIIGPFNCQHLQRPLPMSASVTPVHSDVSAPEGKLEIATIYKVDPKQTFDFLRIVFSLRLLIYQNIPVSQMRAPLPACREPTGKLWQLCKVLYVFEHKTLLIRAPFTPYYGILTHQ